MKKVCKVVILVLCISLLIAPVNQVNAYVLIDGKLELESKFIPSKNFGETTYSHMNEALWQWNKAAGDNNKAKTIFTISNDRHSDDNDKNYGYNRVYSNDDFTHQIFKEQRLDISKVGQTAKMTYTYSNIFGSRKVIENADILINMRYKFANSAKPGAYDTWSIFLHEAGHALGLDEEPNKNYNTSVMYPGAAPNVTKRYLLDDDKKAVKAKNY